jgi:hypothetical protein
LDFKSFQLLAEERIDASRRSRRDGDDPDAVSILFQKAGKLRAAPFGAAGKEFGDEQIDFHLAAVGGRIGIKLVLCLSL